MNGNGPHIMMKVEKIELTDDDIYVISLLFHDDPSWYRFFFRSRIDQAPAETITTTYVTIQKPNVSPFIPTHTTDHVRVGIGD